MKHGLVEQPEDWPFSSVHRDMREGWISIPNGRARRNGLHEPVRGCGVTLAYEPLFEVPITNASDDTSASRSNSGAQLGGAGNVQTPSTQ